MNPSKICKLLFVVLSFKVAVACFMITDPLGSSFNSLLGYMAGHQTAQGSVAAKQGVAHAAEVPQGAGAPPVVLPTGTATKSGGVDAAAGNRVLPKLDFAAGKGAEAGQDASTGNPSASDSSLTRDMLSRKQEELTRKEQELLALESELTQKLDRLEELEMRLGSMMKEAQSTNDAKFKHLVDVLSNMKAKAAAQVLETLDFRIAVKVLANMRGRQAGEILTFVKPEIAASLTGALTRMQMPAQ